jgi:starch synthase
MGERQDLPRDGLSLVSGMKVLFLAAEATPFVKVGGLADVAGELPPILRSMGADVRVVLPFHDMLHEEDLYIEPCTEVQFKHPHGQETAQLFLAEKDQFHVYLVDGDPVRNAPKVYGEPSADAYKFTFTFLAAMEAMRKLDWQPDILHAHDWHAAPAVAWLAGVREMDPFYKPVASLLTVHNLPYMGSGGEAAMEYYGIPPSGHPNLPFWARHLPLPIGLASADWINTVSPTYAQEIKTAAYAYGLEELLRIRTDRVVGILNGIDVRQWDPANDPSIPVHYSRETLTIRSHGKRDLQKHLGFRHEPHIPLVSMISRLDYQKGVDIALAALGRMEDEQWQFVLLGSGDKELEGRAKVFEETYRDRVRVVLRFDAELARKIYAGADMILVPSRYEPCGLSQMIAMRYGCVPIVSATGGLKDTVIDYGVKGSGTGFVYSPNEPPHLSHTIRAAIEIYSDQRRWRGLQLRGMAKDFSWERSARQYLNLYQKARKERHKTL